MPELIRPTQAELDRMSHPDKDALILLLFDVLARYEQRLSEVESKVEKTSQNSSKPPSSDGLKKGPAKPRNGARSRWVVNPDTQAPPEKWSTPLMKFGNYVLTASARAALVWTACRRGWASVGSQSRFQNPKRW